MHALLSQDHEGSDHGMLRSLSHRCATISGPEEPQRSDSRVPEDALGASLKAASRDWFEVVLQQPRRFGPVREKELWKDSCIPMRWSSNGASSLFFILFSPGWSPEHLSWHLLSASFAWRK